MKDMVSRIIEMDKTAREVTQKVKNEKLTLEKEIKDLKKKIRSEYLERARKRIEINRETEQKFADEKIEIIKKEKDEICQRIKNQYDKNYENWTNTIVSHVLEA